jgi:hypothetical protein
MVGRCRMYMWRDRMGRRKGRRGSGRRWRRRRRGGTS